MRHARFWRRRERPEERALEETNARFTSAPLDRSANILLRVSSAFPAKRRAVPLERLRVSRAEQSRLLSRLRRQTRDRPVAVGERFGEFETPHGLDAFGERGEFHTLVRVWEVPRRAALGV